MSLVGMHIPPNYGLEYTERFHEVLPTYQRKQIQNENFMLEGFELNEDFFLSDLIHLMKMLNQSYSRPFGKNSR